MTDLGKILGKRISTRAFGVMQFGGKADRSASAELYAMARAAGITLFDAAWNYTGGAAETLLGAFAEAEADQVVLISKCAYARDLSAADIRAQVGDSRDRLRTRCIDILYLHRYPGDDRLEDHLQTMAELHAEGAYRLLGLSNFAAWQVMKARSILRRIGGPEVSLLQPMYNLLKRQAEVELLPMAQSEGLAVHAYSPLGGGMLSGKYLTDASGRITEDTTYARRYQAAWMSETVRGLANIAAEIGIAPATLAIRLGRPPSGYHRTDPFGQPSRTVVGLPRRGRGDDDAGTPCPAQRPVTDPAARDRPQRGTRALKSAGFAPEGRNSADAAPFPPPVRRFQPRDPAPGWFDGRNRRPDRS